MKIKFFILFLVSFTANLNAQDIGRIYNEYINKAELYITQGKYIKALQQYDEAFSTTKIDFANDLYNASVCAVMLKDNAKVLVYADKLASKAVGKNFFSRNIYKTFIPNKDFKGIVAKAEQNRKQKAEANKEYNLKLREFIALDSTYNKLRRDKYYESYKLPDTLENLFRRNTINLLNHIKSQGYYSEKKLGADIAADTIIRSMRKPDIVFLHYLEMGNDKMLVEEIKAMLLNNLTHGNIKPYHITGFIEMSDHVFGDTGSWLYKIYNCQLYRKNEVQELDKINQTRNLYFMNSIADFDEKIKFRYSEKSSFDFKYNIIQSDISDLTYFQSAFHVIAPIKNCKD